MRIGEVAEQTGLSISNIRFYEKKGLIEPAREQQSKYRDYTQADVERLKMIILYRKMDLPIETISSLIKGECSAESVMERQIRELTAKQEMLQGSIDLCRKMLSNGVFEGFDVDYYLNYVKEEEKSGTKFAEVEELLTDFVSFTQMDRFLGDPYVGGIFSKLLRNRFALILLGLFWIAVPMVGIIDECLKGDDTRIRMIVFWAAWMVFFGWMFVQFRRRKHGETHTFLQKGGRQ